ncbi:MAG: hypothetical protein R6W67_07380, partial [Bacteroidales bacterium]
DPDAVRAAIEAARAETGRPTLICCRTIIGWGAPNKQGTEATHGAALGADEVAQTRANIGWPHAPFVIPEEIRAGWDARERGAALEADWDRRMTAYAAEYPEQGAELARRLAGALPDDWPQASGAVIQVSGIRYQVSGIRYQVSGIVLKKNRRFDSLRFIYELKLTC